MMDALVSVSDAGEFLPPAPALPALSAANVPAPPAVDAAGGAFIHFVLRLRLERDLPNNAVLAEMAGISFSVALAIACTTKFFRVIP